MVRLSRAFVVSIFFAVAFVPAAAAQVPPTLLFECEHTVTGGDNLSRGFYLPSFPGTRLDTVDLWISSPDSDTFTVTLTARADTYDGAVLGTATAMVDLDDEQKLVTFDFGGVSVTPGSTVTFSFHIDSGTGLLHFNVGTCDLGDAGCTACGGGVIETDGTSPPLSTFRRNSVGIRVYGSVAAPEPIPTLGRAGVLLLVLFLTVAGMLAIKAGIIAGR